MAITPDKADAPLMWSDSKWRKRFALVRLPGLESQPLRSALGGIVAGSSHATKISRPRLGPSRAKTWRLSWRRSKTNGWLPQP